MGIGKIEKKLHVFFTKGNIRSLRAKKNVAYSFALKGLSIIVGFFYVPLILGYLDSEHYGVWLTLSSIIAWVSFFDIGLGNGLRNRLTEALADDDNLLARTYVSTAYAIISAISLLLIAVINIVIRYIDWQNVLNTSIISNKELIVVSSIIFSFFMIRFILKLFGSILLADQRPAINSAFGPIGNVISFIIIIILTKTTAGSLLYLSLVLSITPVFVLSIASFYFFNSYYKKLKPSFAYVDLRKAYDLLTLGFKFFFIQIAFLVIYQSSLFIITKMFGPEEVTKYHIVFKYFSLITMSFGIILMPFWSAYTDAMKKSDFTWIISVMRKLILIWIGLLLLVIIMLISSDFFYKIWINDDINIPFRLSLSMAIYVVINSWNAIFTGFINGAGKIKLQLYFSVIKAVVFIPLAIFLGEHWGVAGVVYAGSILAMINAIWQPIQYKKIISHTARGIWNK
jgi:O-antigen/teichoic acid export membrane protein